MKNVLSLSFVFSCLLSACGGGDNFTTQAQNQDFSTMLANTRWQKSCFPIFQTDNNTRVQWYVNIDLTIDNTLVATYVTEFFRPTDNTCSNELFNSLDKSKFEIIGKVTSAESIDAFGLNETFLYNDHRPTLPPNYTLVYLASERLYFGHATHEHSGETIATRHSSISLDDFYLQIVN